MSDRSKEYDGFSIVTAGSFNPAIFHPLWFVRNNLIREEEGTEADLQVTHKEAAVFNTPWFSLQATHDRVVITSEDPTKGHPLRDLVSGTFMVLEHTPIQACGLNRMMHFKMTSEDDWHEFGHYFAPKTAWDAILTKPGLKSLTIQGTHGKLDPGTIHINLQPSAKVVPGVYLHIHLHRDLISDKLTKTNAMTRFQTTLKDDWGAFITYCDDVAEKLFTSFDNRKG